MISKLFNNFTRKLVKRMKRKRGSKKTKARGPLKKKEIGILHKAADNRAVDVNWPKQFSQRALNKIEYFKPVKVPANAVYKTARRSLIKVKKTMKKYVK